MNLESISALDYYFKKNPNLKGTPIKESDIVLAQKDLGVLFNKDYVFFIKKYGGASAGIDIYSISSSCNSNIIGNENVIEKTKSFWKEFSQGDNFLKKLYVISDDGAGNPILMHTNGEIYIFYHDDYSIENTLF